MFFVCLEHEACTAEMSFSEYEADDSDHVWINVG